MSRQPIVVAKFGSSVLRRESDLPTAVHEIFRHVRRGRRVIAVVSAIGSTTDELLARAKAWSDPGDARSLATLLATGESVSSALLGLVLHRAGVPAGVIDHREAGLRTQGPTLNAEPVALDRAAIERELERAPVLVVPGFVGSDIETGYISLLGRGGSDLTAVFIARELGAEKCILVKDVDGVYTSDPNEPGTDARRYETLCWDTARGIAGVLVQPKAVDYAKSHSVEIEVTSFGSDSTTRINAGPSRVEGQRRRKEPVRVGLLGAGTVGLGVYERLDRVPELFRVTRVLVRNPGKRRRPPVQPELLTADVEDVFATDCGVVVELIGGVEPARAYIERALRSGRSVVTANKAVLAAHGAHLERLAAEHGVRLLYSASVGGCVPVLEALVGGGVERVQGVLNGTTNYVLDRLFDGSDFAGAVAQAQLAGYAEANPTLDLSGMDAAHKVSIVARCAFGGELDAAAIDREGIESIDGAAVERAKRAGRRFRLVAECHLNGAGPEASVRVRELEADHPLAQVRDAENAAMIHLCDGSVRVVRGLGAGRWPTTEAVVADLLDLALPAYGCRAEPMPVLAGTIR